MKGYIGWLLHYNSPTFFVVLAFLSATLFIFELIVVFIIWEMSWTALRLEIAMLIISAVPYVVYKLEKGLEKRNERN